MAVCFKVLPESEFTASATEVAYKDGHKIPMAKGDLSSIPKNARQFIAEKALLMKPTDIYVCDGSRAEQQALIADMQKVGAIKPLKAYENEWIVKTDPRDVARVESKTCICTPDKYQTVCHTAEGVAPIMGNWIEPEAYKKELDSRFPGCYAGRRMYVIPFSMGPVGGPLSKIGVELTDSIYVVLCMGLMTRMGSAVWGALGDGEFVRGIHSVGVPLPATIEVKVPYWPCNPERVIISHRPAEREIWSFGSGYGGNSLLGKKCFALRIAMNIAHDEGWMAEHMLIMGVTPPGRKERFIAAAFPSACGKTNLAMLEPPESMSDYQVRVIGDDIAWMRFRADGQLVGINPEYGFFGVCPGTTYKTNPMAMRTFQKNSIMTNTAETADGEYFWEGLEDEMKNKDVEITTWLNEKWKIGMPGKAAHPNSRFTTPAGQCPIIHPNWESPEGVPIDAFFFGGRRPEGVPLIYESFSWAHGIFVGCQLKSEATAAAEHAGKTVMHDPFAMRPFMGYNCGKYMEHWLSLNKAPNKVPKIYHVNWFRLTPQGKFLWPGFGENLRVIDWVLRRLDGDNSIGVETAIGVLPTKGSINLKGIEDKVDWDQLFDLPKDYWQEDSKEVRKFMEDQIGPDMPAAIRAELDAQEQRIAAMK
jgi:phosphoenolpyruvate carboxykinase (GTP)